MQYADKGSNNGMRNMKQHESKRWTCSNNCNTIIEDVEILLLRVYPLPTALTIITCLCPHIVFIVFGYGHEDDDEDGEYDNFTHTIVKVYFANFECFIMCRTPVGHVG